MKRFFRLLMWKSTLLASRVLFLFMALNSMKAQQPESYAAAMAESIMQSHPDSYGGWDYVTGTVLRGYTELWKITGEKKYYDYIKNTVDKAVNANGSINGYILSDYNIDQIKEGCAVLFLYRETGLEKYKTASNLLRQQLKEHPRTTDGAFWHKQRYPWQIWLDGLYMGSPFLAEYGELFNEPEAIDDVVNQLLLTHKHTLDSVTGLYYHGWDEKREQEWADSVTGQSPSFWGRAMGWYAMALVDALDFIPVDHPGRDSVLTVVNQFSQAVKNYQDGASGVWWQVTDQGNREGNYLESSASCMFVYALAKAARMGYIDTAYRSAAIRGFEGILGNFVTAGANGSLNLGQTCLTAGLGYGRDGSYEYYVYETVITSNDGKALGPFILAALEIENAVYPPTGLKQDTTFKEGVKLSWQDNSGNETAFLVYKYQDNMLDSVIQLAGNTQIYTDTAIVAGIDYSYGIAAVNESDTSTMASLQHVINYFDESTGLDETMPDGEDDFVCFPNPVKESFTLTFTLSQDERIWLRLVDAAGRIMKIIPGDRFTAGKTQIEIDAHGFNTGVYFCTLFTDTSIFYEKLIVN
ncbi:MAG: glycoside hydrolase family 88 protein [Bacteroidales bacterium]|nr:glycoside hydrolase family 88 protein [Bacteroidales bacterium]